MIILVVYGHICLIGKSKVVLMLNTFIHFLLLNFKIPLSV